jgi:hypothetical protein
MKIFTLFKLRHIKLKEIYLPKQNWLNNVSINSFSYDTPIISPNLSHIFFISIAMISIGNFCSKEASIS